MSGFTQEQWTAIWTVALGKTSAIPGPGGVGIRGRSIAKAVSIVAVLWGRYGSSLRPHLTTLAIAALDALVAALVDIVSVNPPGPE